MSCKRIGNKDGIGLYEIIIECGYDLSTGKRIRKKKRFSGTRTDAELYEAELKRKYYHKCKNLKIVTLTFKEYSELFIKNYCIPNVSKVTTRGYKHMISKIIPLIGDIKLRNIDSYMLDKMYIKLRDGSRKKEGLSPKSMIHYYNLLTLMFKQAKKWRFIDNNPNEEATRPKLTRKKRNFYDNEQVITLLDCLEKEQIKVRTIITLALYTGIRKGELCALRWSDIDYDKKTLFIDNSLKVVNGIVDEEKAKTEYSVRYVNLGVDILSLLDDYKEWQNSYIIEMGEKWIGTDRIFTSINGEHMHPDTPNKLLQKFLKKYDLPKITFHELRHTCASILNSHGIDPKTISEQLGHANADITLNIYTHSFDDEKKKCAKVFDELYEKTTNI